MTTQFNADEARALVERLTGFTRGPWEVDMSYQWPSKVRAAPPYNERWICDAAVQPSANDQSHTLANARLIAAAPDLHRHLTAALAENERLRKALPQSQGWRDISSAPRDGTPCLVAWVCLNGSYDMEVAHFSQESWFDRYEEFSMQPTHWMPLPTGPDAD